jgi:hypothetical protein
MSGTPIYRVWTNMRGRCYSPKDIAFPNYGGRGISVCGEWMASFTNFLSWAEASGYRAGLSLDRIDVNGNYEPSNCRWVTIGDNCRNQRRSRRYVFRGEEMAVSEAARRFNIQYCTLLQRITQYGMSPDEAISKPVKSTGRSIDTIKAKSASPDELVSLLSWCIGFLPPAYKEEAKRRFEEIVKDLPEPVRR